MARLDGAGFYGAGLYGAGLGSIRLIATASPPLVRPRPARYHAGTEMVPET
jgi:hypothetical protein